MKNKILMLMIVGQVGLCVGVDAQNVGISASSTFTPDGSAILDISSTTKGLLIPRVDPTQFATLSAATASPATGLMVYNTTTNALNINTGTTGIPVFYSLLSSNITTPLIYTAGTSNGTASGALSIQAATSLLPGYLTTSEYATFIGKQDYLSNTTTASLGFVKATTTAGGLTTISYDQNTYIASLAGTINYVPKYLTASTFTNNTSLLFDDGSHVGINIAGTTSTAATSTLQVGGSFATATGSYGASPTTTQWATASLVLVTTATTITLPTAVGVTGRIYTIKNNNVTSFNVIPLASTPVQTIDGASTIPLSAAYKFITVQSDGINWYIIANN